MYYVNPSALHRPLYMRGNPHAYQEEVKTAKQPLRSAAYMGCAHNLEPEVGKRRTAAGEPPDLPPPNRPVKPACMGQLSGTHFTKSCTLNGLVRVPARVCFGCRALIAQATTNGPEDIARGKICDAVFLHLQKCENHRSMSTLDSVGEPEIQTSDLPCSILR